MPYVDENGEVGECPTCENLRIELDATKAALRGRQIELAKLNGERAQKRLNHERREEIESIFDYWRTICGHPRSRLLRGDGTLDPDRFDAILWALLTYGDEMCRLAIYGASVSAPERRGHRYDDLSKYVFKNVESFERYANLGARLRSGNG